MQSGVHDITIEQYHNGPGVSRSGLETFRRSPLHYWHEYLNPNKPAEDKPEITTRRDALQFGNAFHTYVLEPQEFEKRYMLADKINRSTTVGKKAYQDMLAEKGGRELLCRESFADIVSMNQGIDRSTTARGLIEDGAYEQSLFWTDKDTGMLCKVRPDIWHKNMIVDLKTCANASFREFQRSVYSYGYYIQAAMIHEALFALYGINMMNFIFVAIEKEAPHAVAVYQLDELAIHRGIEDFKKALFEMKQCFDNDRWPSYPDAIITLPAYA